MPVPARLRRSPLAHTLALALTLGTGAALAAGGHTPEAAHGAAPVPAKATAPAPAPAAKAPAATQPTPGDPQVVVDRIRATLTKQADPNKLHVLVGDEPILPKTQTGAHTATARKTGNGHGTVKAHDHAKARAAALAGHAAPTSHGGDVHWAYEGAHGPEQWGHMKPEFNTCSSGKRQSPIHIQSTDAAPGPAEPIEFHYSGSGGSVVNNGHTIQVDPMGHNWIKVRGSVYKLVQFHFHHPAEEKINYKGFAMVAHLVHKNEAGQLAVVAVLMDVGANNDFLQKVWIRMPLEPQDRVPLPDDLLNLNELLPGDQRYYQFMGSLTTPPCSEGVLWMVMKQPVTLGADQLKLFTKLFPMNARPVQAVNGRLVREAM